VPLDPHVARLLESLAMSPPRSAADLSVQERRLALARLLAFGGEPDAVDGVAECVATGPDWSLTLRVYAPLQADSAVLPGLVYFHGGGLVAGSLDTHDGICRALANASRCKVLSVAYRLAPEARFPAALEDACRATRWVAANAGPLGLDPAKLGVGGDSAGGTLAAAVAQRLSIPGEPKLAFQLLLCPILDYGARTESRRLFEAGHLLDRCMIEHDLACYLRAGDDPADPRVSPLRASRLGGLPPAVIHTAECDPLRDEGALYADRLRDAGAPVRYRCHSGMIHLFYGLKDLIPYAVEAIRLMGADVRAFTV
jgi:acetyl esterase